MMFMTRLKSNFPGTFKPRMANSKPSGAKQTMRMGKKLGWGRRRQSRAVL